jgi:purine-cytosine permease-like protein
MYLAIIILPLLGLIFLGLLGVMGAREGNAAMLY